MLHAQCTCTCKRTCTHTGVVDPPLLTLTGGVGQRMGRVSVETRRRIVLLRTHGYSLQSIQERLDQEDIIISKMGIQKLLRKFEASGTVGDLSKKRSKLLNEDQLAFIDESLKKK